MNTSPQPFDSGRQNERTALAWTRTGLALLAAVLIAARITVPDIGVVAVAFAAVALPLAGAVVLLAARRYRAARAAVGTRRALPDGRLPVAVAAVVVTLAVVELIYVLAFR